MSLTRTRLPRSLASVPADRQGPQPLLQELLDGYHPPSLYTGFVGMTIRSVLHLPAHHLAISTDSCCGRPSWHRW